MVRRRSGKFQNAADCLRFNIDPALNRFVRAGNGSQCSKKQSHPAHTDICIYHRVWTPLTLGWCLARSYTLTC